MYMILIDHFYILNIYMYHYSLMCTKSLRFTKPALTWNDVNEKWEYI